MSKENFSKTMSDLMYRKIKSLEYLYIDDFFKKDEYFELALCLSYMTLSKEKIIRKEIKNKDRIGRLTNYVDTSTINKVFDPSFSEEPLRIISAKENNNVWILDNIRDSIMHGAFDIDEQRKCFIINNNQHDRDLHIEVPFSWFIAYAKNDILSKKILDKYTIRGFYYNKQKIHKQNLNTKGELFRSILYEVRITGSEFNVKKIEKRVRELFKEYSQKDIDSQIIKTYQNSIDLSKIKYNEEYLISFYNAKDNIKKIIESEYPGTIVDIHIDNRKYKIQKRASKRMHKHYQNYDLFYENLSNIIKNKSNSLLNYISNIIENLDVITEIDYQKCDDLEKMELINYLMNDEYTKYTKSREIYDSYQNNLKMLRSICLNVYGLATLVINHENIYNDYFQGLYPQEYKLLAYTKQPYTDYANKRKNIIMKILKKEIDLFEKKEQLSKCNSETGKNKIKEIITNIEQEINNLHKDLENNNYSFIPHIIEEYRNISESEKLDSVIKRYYEHFSNAKTVPIKEKIKEIIAVLLDAQIKEQSKYTFGLCNMSDAIKIIRNSFSHIGRVYIGKNKNLETTIILSDYDNNGEKSGEVICRYCDLINLLRMPLDDDKKLVKTKGEN